MNLTKLISMVRALSPSEITDVDDDIITDLINEANTEALSMHRWPFLVKSSSINVTDGTQGYALPNDFDFILAVYETSESRMALQEISADQYFTRFGDDDTESDRADVYFLLGSNINFYPIPSANATGKYTLRYYSQPATLSSGSSSPTFPSQFHMLLVDAVRSRLYERIGAVDEANMFRAKFLDMVERMREYYNRRGDNYPLIWGDGSRYRYHLDPNLPFLDTV